MVTKLTIVCLCMVCGAMVGINITKRKRRRVDYFESCVKVTEKLISDISFKRKNLPDILNEYAQTDRSDLASDLRSYSSLPYDDFTTSAKYVKPAEKILLKDFFGALGAADAQTQLFELNNYKQRFDDIYGEERERFNKTGKTVLKLSVLIGLGIGILIL